MQWKRWISCLRMPAASSSQYWPMSSAFSFRLSIFSCLSSSSLMGVNSRRSNLPSMSFDNWPKAFFHSSSWPDSFPRMSLMSLFRSSKVVSKVDLLTLESK
ncbi:hypothetical protein NP493_709g03065 [Ridgeia piscesae]|uniref:Uncharacterized protein n=1 Tax=Ridgeia piscesae TaxID=27915 RepID=A0AAD9KRZ4_RIDPI|nr:hypothetical protein NP493_709g03065 [Ridgeia piscesae]